MCDELIVGVTSDDLVSYKGKKLEIKNKESADKVVEALSQVPFIVQKVESKQGKTHPSPPFTTSTLQQVANQRLGFSVRKTMTTAQRLYESGYITYMRTDSVNLSQEAIAAARDLISQNFGKDYLPTKANVFKSKESAQEAHEAIRPSHPDVTYQNLPSTIDRDGQRLYKLIYDRYLACQMSDQVYETTTVTVGAGDYTLKASGRVVLFDGFRRVWPSSTKDEILPKVSENEPLTLEKVIPTQHFTQPPARYSEATLVRELEKDGIGRPSTYASIIATIQERGYVRLESGRFYAEKMGEIVTDRLRQSFSKLMDLNFTAKMENDLDEIAHGKLYWIDNLNAFYDVIDRVSILTSDKEKNIVTLETRGDMLVLKSSSVEIGRVEEKMPITKNNDEDIKISFSAKYMMEALKSFSTETVDIHFVGEIKPILIKSSEDETLTQLVLPIRTY